MILSSLEAKIQDWKSFLLPVSSVKDLSLLYNCNLNGLNDFSSSVFSKPLCNFGRRLYVCKSFNLGRIIEIFFRLWSRDWGGLDL